MMDDSKLCLYCDNTLRPNESKCYVCNANSDEIRLLKFKETKIQTQSNVIKEKDDKVKSGLTFRGINKEIISEISQGSSNEDIHNGLSIKNDTMKTNEEVKDKTLEAPESLWICSFCTFLNNSTYLCCEACFKDKIPSKENTKTDENNLWICSFCEHINKMDNNICEKCDKNKDKTNDDKTDNFDKVEIFQTNYYDKENSETKIIKAIWTCQSCQYNNKMEDKCCAVCHSDKISINDDNINQKINNIESDIGPMKSLPGGHPWECMTCNFLNDLLTLKCYSCNANNQIFRMCSLCNTCFIMNDFDNTCTECAGKGRQGTSLTISDSASDKKSTNVKTKGIGELFKKMSFQSKPRVCSNTECNTEMNKKETICTKCGSNIKLKNDKRRSLEIYDNSLQSIRNNSLLLFNSKKNVKDKLWICDNENCQRENKIKEIYCKSCSKIRVNNEPPKAKLKQKKSNKKKWKCDNEICGKKNKNDATFCNKCKKSKPGEVEDINKSDDFQYEEM